MKVGKTPVWFSAVCFWPQFFRRDDPTFLWQIVNAIYHPPFGKVWLSSVCWSPSGKHGNVVKCRIYGGWVKTRLQFEAVCGPQFTSFWDDVGDPLWFATHFPAYVMFRSETQAVTFALKLRNRGKKWFLGPWFVGGRDISDMHFQIALPSDLVAGYGWVPFSELRG